MNGRINYNLKGFGKIEMEFSDVSISDVKELKEISKESREEFIEILKKAFNGVESGDIEEKVGKVVELGVRIFSKIERSQKIGALKERVKILKEQEPLIDEYASLKYAPKHEHECSCSKRKSSNVTKDFGEFSKKVSDDVVKALSKMFGNNETEGRPKRVL